MPNTEQQQWEDYVQSERSVLESFLASHGYQLDDIQPHTQGERFLMQAVTTSSGRKIILLGHAPSGERVVIKATSDTRGSKELEHERVCRTALKNIAFAYEPFYTPREIFFGRVQGQTISIQEFIAQDSTFLARTIEEQFKLALKGFKIQESAHATTYEHAVLARRTFGSRSAREYISSYIEFTKHITESVESSQLLLDNLEAGRRLLEEGEEQIEQYTGFLTHSDFVPHNIRIRNGDIYLLDHSSLRFGNKYEGWARFLNFMTLYNPELERYLVTYVKVNRSEEEAVSLHLMRIYRLAEIIWYYTLASIRSEGNLKKLNCARISFWSEVLNSLLKGNELPDSVLHEYKEVRDSLRSDEEKARQEGLH